MILCVHRAPHAGLTLALRRSSDIRAAQAQANTRVLSVEQSEAVQAQQHRNLRELEDLASSAVAIANELQSTRGTVHALRSDNELLGEDNAALEAANKALEREQSALKKDIARQLDAMEDMRMRQRARLEEYVACAAPRFAALLSIAVHSTEQLRGAVEDALARLAASERNAADARQRMKDSLAEVAQAVSTGVCGSSARASG